MSSAAGVFLLALSASAGNLAPHMPGELIVRIRGDLRGEARIERERGYLSALSALGARDVGGVPSAPRFRKVEVPAGVKLDQAIRALSAADGVEYAEPNYLYSTAAADEYLPLDKGFGEQWALANTGQRFDEGERGKYRGREGFDIGIRRLWSERADSLRAAADVKVAVIDTGIDWKHPDLADNIWVNPGETGPLAPDEKAPLGCKDRSCNGKDDDGNGHVDDWRGWNWGVIPRRGQPLVGNNDPFDDNGHGTHVAGVIGARHDDRYIAGINDRVRLIALKFLTKEGSGTLEGAIGAVLYAGRAGADVINASWGGGGESQALEEVVGEVVRRGVLFVAAAGNSAMDNDLFDNWPANYPFPGLISVAASEPRGQLAFFSCYGRKRVHLTAPGHLILSTLPGQKMQALSGTSMAAPQVAGVAALVLGLRPELKGRPAELRRHLMRTSVIGTGMLGKTVSGGHLNAWNAATGTIPAGHQRPDTDAWSALVEKRVESPHPYGNNVAQEYVIHAPGASWIRVRIGRHALEKGKDHLEVYDGAGNLYDAVTGFGTQTVTAPVRGDTVKLVLRSDASVGGWGFETLGYEVIR